MSHHKTSGMQKQDISASFHGGGGRKRETWSMAHARHLHFYLSLPPFKGCDVFLSKNQELFWEALVPIHSDQLILLALRIFKGIMMCSLNFFLDHWRRYQGAVGARAGIRTTLGTEFQKTLEKSLALLIYLFFQRGSRQFNQFPHHGTCMWIFSLCYQVAKPKLLLLLV